MTGRWQLALWLRGGDGILAIPKGWIRCGAPGVKPDLVGVSTLERGDAARRRSSVARGSPFATHRAWCAREKKDTVLGGAAAQAASSHLVGTAQRRSPPTAPRGRHALVFDLGHCPCFTDPIDSLRTTRLDALGASVSAPGTNPFPVDDAERM